MKTIVVGRHTPSGKEGIEIVGNEDDQGRPQPQPASPQWVCPHCGWDLSEHDDMGADGVECPQCGVWVPL